MTHGSLFSGIGGFDLAAEWMGWQNVFHCEWNTFGQRVLKFYWPDAISYHDITKTDFTIHRGRIDILTGGFPCQPYSMAGKRLGKEDDRHLWPEMLRAIREIQPRWVVGENVLGLVNWSNGLVFHEVQADLEAEGYEVQPFVLPAVSVNAPHRRDRVWFVAYAGKLRLEQRKASGIVGDRQEEVCGEGSQSALQSTPTSEIRDAADTNGNGQHGSDCEHEEQPSEARKYAQRHLGESDDDGDATDTNVCTTGTSGEGGSIESDWGADDVQQSQRGSEAEQHHRPSSFSRDAANTTGEQGERVRPQFRESCEPEQGQFGRNGSEVGSKRDAPDTDGIGRRENERKRNRESNVINKNGTATNWETFPTVSPICDGNDGISDRLDGITFPKWRQESIKAGGNAVVPQVVLSIFRTIEDYEKMNTP